jgi:hypothetical protein
MGKIADYLKNYDNASTAGGYSSAVYTFVDHIYGTHGAGLSCV